MLDAVGKYHKFHHGIKILTCWKSPKICLHFPKNRRYWTKFPTMAPPRIRIAQDKADLVKALAASDSKTGLFSTYADVVLFAAAFGIKRRKREPLQTISKREPGPIAQDYFINRGYDVVIDLIAIGEVKDKEILSSGKPEVETQRIQIFEEYANGGLEILQEELKGAIDYAEQILLMMLGERFHTEESGQKSFDLSRFL